MTEKKPPVNKKTPVKKPAHAPVADPDEVLKEAAADETAMEAARELAELRRQNLELIKRLDALEEEGNGEYQMDKVVVRDEAVKADTKSTRKPLGTQQRLAVPQEVKDANPGFTFRWINNEHGRIQQALSGGWVPVEGQGLTSVWNPNKNDSDRASQTGGYMMQPVGVGRTEDSISAILMKLPIHLFEEDKEFERQKVRQIEKSLKRGSVDSLDLRVEGASDVQTYAPKTEGDVRGLHSRFEDV